MKTKQELIPAPKGQVNLAVVIGLFIGFMILVTSLAPLMSTSINAWPTDNPNANGLAVFIIPALFTIMSSWP